MKYSQASTTLHLPPPMSPESPLSRNGLPFIRIPYPATSVPRDRVVLQAVSVALAGTRQNPITRFLLLLPSIAVFWLSLFPCVDCQCDLIIRYILTHCNELPYTSPPPLHANRPLETLYCGPARLLTDLPSRSRSSASVVQQLVGD